MPRRDPWSRWLHHARRLTASAALLAAAGCASDSSLGRRTFCSRDDNAKPCAHSPGCRHVQSPVTASESVPGEMPSFDLPDASPDQYLLDSGDVLGLSIDGIPLAPPPEPSQLPQAVEPPPASEDLNAVPVEVQPEGMIELPLLPPMSIRGRTVPEVERLLNHLYASEQVLDPSNNAVRVTLKRARPIRVLVVRRNAATGDASAVPMDLSIPVDWQKGSGAGLGTVVSLRGNQGTIPKTLASAGQWPAANGARSIHVLRMSEGTPRRALTARDLSTPAPPRRLSGVAEEPGRLRSRGVSLERTPVRLLSVDFGEGESSAAPQSLPNPTSQTPFPPTQSARYGGMPDGSSYAQSSPDHIHYYDFPQGMPPVTIPEVSGSNSYRFRSSNASNGDMSSTVIFMTDTATGDCAPYVMGVVGPMPSCAMMSPMPDGEILSTPPAPTLSVPVHVIEGDRQSIGDPSLLLNDGDVLCIEAGEPSTKVVPQPQPGRIFVDQTMRGGVQRSR